LKGGRQIHAEDGDGRQGIEADYRLSVGSKDESVGDSSADVLPDGIALELFIQRFDSTGECRPVVLLSERLEVQFRIHKVEYSFNFRLLKEAGC
jgi:hypothetical protein